MRQRIRREFRTIDEWPWPKTPADQRQRSRFDAPYSQTIELLDRETRMLDADVAYLCLDMPDSSILKDRSGPRATVRDPDWPAVMLVLEGTTHGTLRYGTDKFDGYGTGQASWQHNLRAIALGMESLRKVDRYGIAESGQQYRGFAALPAPASDDSTHMTHDNAVSMLVGVLGRSHDEVVQMAASDPNRLRRVARAAVHPDVRDGDSTMWHAIAQALALVTGSRG